MAPPSDSRQLAVVAVSITFAMVTFLVVFLRLFTRIYVLKKMSADDYLIVAATVLSWLFIAVTIEAVRSGLGLHFKDTNPAKLPTYLFTVWLSSIFYLACLGCIKASVLWFYTRLGDRSLTHLSRIMSVVIVSQAAANVMTATFQCTPVRKAWQPLHPGTCIDVNAFYIANAALNILTDILTYTLPIGVILKLQMPQKQKVVLFFVLCLGLLACVSSIVRITYIPAMLTSADYTFVISRPMYWSVIETNIGILAASIPSLKALMSRFLPQVIGGHSSKKHQSASHGRYRTRLSSTHSDEAVKLNTLYGRGGSATAANTHIAAAHEDTSSTDRIVPSGRILAKTDIATEFEYVTG